MFAWFLPVLVFLAWMAALFAALGGLRAQATHRKALAVAAACLAPSAAAWMLGIGWRLIPGMSNVQTVVWLAGTAGALIATGAWRARATGFAAMPEFTLRPRPSWLVLAVLLLAIVYLVLRIPPYSHDPLEYASVARLLDAHRSLSLYPVLDSAASGGLYAPWTHPPGFPLLMALVMACAQVDAGTALKWVAALHVVLCLGALAVLLPKKMRWVAVLSLTATPAYMIGVVNGYVEAVRLTALVGVFAACISLWQAPLVPSAVRLGLLFGLCGYVHSLGILSAAFFLPALLLRRRGSLASRLGWGATIVATQLLMLLPDLWRNVSLFGVVLGDRPAIWQLPEVGRVEYFREFRRLVEPLDILLRGLLQGFSQVSNFGLSYWLTALVVLGIVATGRRPADSSTAPSPQDGRAMLELGVGIVATFYALATALTLMGSVEAIKNPRYVLTVQPFLVIVTAGLLMRLPHPAVARRWLCAALGAFSLVPPAYMAERHPGLLTSGLDRQQAYFVYARPEADAVREVDRLSRPGSCAMLFQQADYAMYGKNCFRSFLDHRFAPVYQESSPAVAAARLRDMKISLILTPSHAMPEIYNTAIGRLLADAALARLEWASGGFALYRLIESPQQTVSTEQRVEIEPPATEAKQNLSVDWTQLTGSSNALSPAGPAGLLCVDASGKGLLELATTPSSVHRTPGPFLRLFGSDSDYVAGAVVAGRRRICVQQLPRQTIGRLQVDSSDGVRVEHMSFSRAVSAPGAAKEP